MTTTKRRKALIMGPHASTIAFRILGYTHSQEAGREGGREGGREKERESVWMVIGNIVNWMAEAQ